MKLACCVWTLTVPENQILEHMNSLGFDWIDIQPHMLGEEPIRSQAKSLGLKVSCMGISFGMPEGASLDHPLEDKREQAIEYSLSAIQHASNVGADCVYVVPGMDDNSDALNHFAESLKILADTAGQAGLKLCIEHFPGRALPTAQSTLDFIRKIDHPHLYLLLDSGHIQMSNEDAQEVIYLAGEKLGYVHFDDNDGQNDLHWSLLDGVMTQESLQQLVDALKQINYAGAVSLELSPKLPSPLESLKKSREILLTALDSR